MRRACSRNRLWTSTISSTPFRRRSSFFLIFFSTFRSYL